MIAKGSSVSSAKSLTHTQGRQGTRAEGATAGPARGSTSGCLGIFVGLDVWLTAEGSGMQEGRAPWCSTALAKVRSATTVGSTRA